MESRLKVKLLKLSFQGEIEISQEIVKLAKRRRKCIPRPRKTDAWFGCVTEQGGPFRGLAGGKDWGIREKLRWAGTKQ